MENSLMDSTVVTPRRAATVLLVDDDMQVLHMLRYNLEEEGYTVLTGADGQMAIQIASTYLPDLIIMDVNMPVYNGLRALEALRGLKDTANTPIILLTGAQSDRVYPALEAFQRVFFIKKPVDLEHINSMIKEALTKYPKVSQ